MSLVIVNVKTGYIEMNEFDTMKEVRAYIEEQELFADDYVLIRGKVKLDLSQDIGDLYKARQAKEAKTS